MTSARVIAVSLSLMGACGPADRATTPHPVVATPEALPVATPEHSAESDMLGTKPTVGDGGAFVPPVPEEFKLPNGLRVWLLPRPSVPLVAMTMVVVGAGANSDKLEESGLAHLTASMLDEGAGKRSAIEFAQAVETLGASFSARVDGQAAYISMSVLKKNWNDAISLFRDAVIAPTFRKPDFERVHAQWRNDLKQRAKDPDAVARVVMRRAVTNKPPWDGLGSAATRLTPERVRKFHRGAYEPGQCALIVVGDVSRTSLEQPLTRAFGNWKDGAVRGFSGRGAGVGSTGAEPTLVIVDRPDAPQSVIGFAREGLSLLDDDYPIAGRANVALGASFTSRLNLDLREKHGWTYGARSRFSATNVAPMFVAWAAVETSVTIDAASAMLKDIREFAANGLTEDEVGKTRSLSRAHLVEVYSTVDSMAEHLALLAASGADSKADAEHATVRDNADATKLNVVAKKYFSTRTERIDDRQRSHFVIVGPLMKLRPRLAELGLGEPQVRDEEGNIIKKVTNK